MGHGGSEQPESAASRPLRMSSAKQKKLTAYRRLGNVKSE